MTERELLVAQSIAEAVVLKDLTARHAQTRARLRELFTNPGQREVGMLQDHRLGTVALEAGRETWAVVDGAAFMAWALENYPDEVQEVTQFEVGLSFRAAVLDHCKRYGGYVDSVTGEVEIPAGVERRKGAPTLVERPDKHAGFVVREALGDVYERLQIEAT